MLFPTPMKELYRSKVSKGSGSWERVRIERLVIEMQVKNYDYYISV